MNQGFGCGHLAAGNQEATLCQALQQLKNEHGPLRKQMDEFYVKAKQVISLEESTCVQEGMRELRRLVVAFERELGPHSEREEGILFPAMVKYIGRETGPIAVMEYEHDQAKKNIASFIESTEELAEDMDYRSIANYATQAYLILTDHFMKEECVLFPMAQQFLSDEEKEELLSKFTDNQTQ